MRGRPTKLIVTLDDPTRQTLEGWLRRQKTPVGLARRVRAILLLAAGTPFVETGKRVGLGERHVRKWAHRFVAEGLDGLVDRPRSGRPPVFSPSGGAARGEDRLRAS
jgi:winged helix-turn helix protein